MSEYYSDQTIRFSVHGYSLFGLLSVPKVKPKAAVIIVVGGPQYRVGSHRQFVLLARYLAEQGVLALRFDYTGMGYSQGVAKKFYEVDEDIKAAVDFVSNHESAVSKIYVWGLCDAASAIAFTAYTDDRINGVVLLNPWVRNEATHSKAVLNNYYRDRLFSMEVWKQLLLSPSKIGNAFLSIGSIVVKILIARSKIASTDKLQEIPVAEREENIAAAIFKGMSSFNGDICLILSGKDLVADEFKQVLNENGWLDQESNNAKTVVHYIDVADHTFSSRQWRSMVERITSDFVNS
ncbi:MAG: hydrolase 1, exosortase A system-associated [Gammaproteobacteria bacterium]